MTRFYRYEELLRTLNRDKTFTSRNTEHGPQNTDHRTQNAERRTQNTEEKKKIAIERSNAPITPESESHPLSLSPP